MRDSAHSLPGHWQDKTILGLSVFLAASPWLLGYADAAVARGNAVTVAVLMGGCAASMLVFRPYWPDFFGAFFAFWLAVSPRILSFTGQTAPALLAYAIGIAVVVLALWSAVRRAHALNRLEARTGRTPPARPPVAPDRSRKAA